PCGWLKKQNDSIERLLLIRCRHLNEKLSIVHFNRKKILRHIQAEKNHTVISLLAINKTMIHVTLGENQGFFICKKLSMYKKIAQEKQCMAAHVKRCL